MENIYFYCEGDTEYNYIKELNRFLRDEGCDDYNLIPQEIDFTADNFLSVAKKEIRSLNGNFYQVYFWIDFDIFKRKGMNKNNIQASINKIPIPRALKLKNKQIIVAFNIMNGEDFLVLHCDYGDIGKWERICASNNHFNNPMVAATYCPLFEKAIIPGYRKGVIPQDFINSAIIKQVIDNNDNVSIKFESGVVEALKLISQSL